MVYLPDTCGWQCPSGGCRVCAIIGDELLLVQGSSGHLDKVVRTGRHEMVDADLLDRGLDHSLFDYHEGNPILRQGRLLYSPLSLCRSHHLFRSRTNTSGSRSRTSPHVQSKGKSTVNVNDIQFPVPCYSSLKSYLSLQCGWRLPIRCFTRMDSRSARSLLLEATTLPRRIAFVTFSSSPRAMLSQQFTLVQSFLPSWDSKLNTCLTSVCTSK